MADLNELEADLKRMIRERNIFIKPSETLIEEPGRSFMAIEEHGKPYKSQIFATRMAIEEHGKPYKSQIFATRMAIEEHGQPHKKFEPFEDESFMCVEEHGQPYKDETFTYMSVIEHGQPYKQQVPMSFSADMKVWEHN